MSEDIKETLERKLLSWFSLYTITLINSTAIGDPNVIVYQDYFRKGLIEELWHQRG